MKVITTQKQLADELALLDVVDSLSVCFIHGALDAQTIVAIRNAARLCDHTVAVNLSHRPVTAVQRSIIEKAGAQFIYEDEPSSSPCFLDAGIKEINATVIMQILITVMPITVTVAENNTFLIRVLKNIQKTFGEFFTLQIKSTPIELLSVAHKKLRTCLAPVLLDIQDGESDLDALRTICAHALQQNGFELKELSFVDADTLEEHVGIIAPTSLLMVEARLDGQSVKDILSLIEG